MAIELGGESFIVGRHGADALLDPSLPVAGTHGEIDYEVLVRLDPTDVFLQQGADGEVPESLVTAAAEFGFRIHAFPLLTLADIRASVTRIDDVIDPAEGLSTAAEEQLAAMDSAWRARPALAEVAGRTLILAWTDPPGVMGPGSFHYQVLESMGFTLVPAAGAPYIEWSAERVVREAPETLLLLLPGADASDRGALLGPLAGGGMPAEMNDQIVIVTDPRCHLPGPYMVELAGRIAAAIEKWAP